jgi:hypothetical protein
MSDNEEERWVKVRLDQNVTQNYQRRQFKRIMRRQELPRGDMTFSDVPYPNSSSNSSDDDIEVDTCIPSPWTQPHGKGNGLASASGSGAARDEIERGDEEEEIFEIEEINPSSYVHMVTPTLRQPQNLDWREKISYKDKTKLVRERRILGLWRWKLALTTNSITHFRKTFMSRS